MLKEAFSNLKEDPIWLNKERGIDIKYVTIRENNNFIPLHDKHDNNGTLILDENGGKQPVDFVKRDNNHHAAIYRDVSGKIRNRIVPFYDATMYAVMLMPIIDKNYNKGEGWQFLFTIKQNEYFVFPNKRYKFNPSEIDLLDPNNYAIISKNLFKVQSDSDKDYFFRHHLDTTSDKEKKVAWNNMEKELQI